MSLDGPQNRSGPRGVRGKSVSPAGNRTPVPQPVVRGYTDCGIPTPLRKSEGRVGTMQDMKFSRERLLRLLVEYDAVYSGIPLPAFLRGKYCLRLQDRLF
jgi:hypothetical protein